MRLEYTVSLREFKQRAFNVKMICFPHKARAGRLVLPFIGHPFLRVETMMLTHGPAAEPIEAIENGLTLTLSPGDELTLTYRVVTPFTECMGADRESEVIFPFISDYEAFFGTGMLAYFEPLQELETDMAISFEAVDLPSGWRPITSMTTGGAHPAKLDGFFWYACRSPQPQETTIRSENGDISFRVLTQKTKNFIPVQIPGFADQLADVALIALAKRWLNWLEKYLAPYSGLRDIETLILRAPDDFSRLTNGRGFATGENVMNGIVAYAPDSADHAARYGYKDYGTFLASGLLHEIMHSYTTMIWQGRYKSVLYPAPQCPRDHQRLLGEALNLYFSDQFLYWLTDRPGEHPGPFLLSHTFREQIRARAAATKRDQLVDLFLFDYGLRLKGSSLMTLFGAMIKSKQAEQPRVPYRSAEFMLEIMRDVLHIHAPELEPLITGSNTPDYARLLPPALASSAQLSDRKE